MTKVRRESLDWALKHALRRGDSDIFPPAFEYRALEANWDEVRDFLANQDVLQWSTRATRTCLSPKGRYGFRVATQLDPLDFLVFCGLVFEIGPDLEGRRLPREAEVVFSFRFSPSDDGSMFDPAVGYRQFLAQCRARVNQEEVKFVAVADIADFYPRLYHHPLENSMAAATTLKSHVTGIMRVLGGWTGRVSYGIPVGSDPARLLAEVAIADVDEALTGAGFTFVRYKRRLSFLYTDESRGLRSNRPAREPALHESWPDVAAAEDRNSRGG